MVTKTVYMLVVLRLAVVAQSGTLGYNKPLTGATGATGRPGLANPLTGATEYLVDYHLEETSCATLWKTLEAKESRKINSIKLEHTFDNLPGLCLPSFSVDSRIKISREPLKDGALLVVFWQAITGTLYYNKPSATGWPGLANQRLVDYPLEETSCATLRKTLEAKESRKINSIKLGPKSCKPNFPILNSQISSGPLKDGALLVVSWQAITGTLSYNRPSGSIAHLHDYTLDTRCDQLRRKLETQEIPREVAYITGCSFPSSRIILKDRSRLHVDWEPATPIPAFTNPTPAITYPKPLKPLGTYPKPASTYPKPLKPLSTYPKPASTYPKPLKPVSAKPRSAKPVSAASGVDSTTLIIILSVAGGVLLILAVGFIMPNCPRFGATHDEEVELGPSIDGFDSDGGYKILGLEGSGSKIPGRRFDSQGRGGRGTDSLASDSDSDSDSDIEGR